MSAPETPPPIPADREGAPPLGTDWRLLGAGLALALLFATAVLATQALDNADEVLCGDRAELQRLLADDPETTCYDGSSAQRAAAVALGLGAAGLAALAALAAVALAAGGRVSRLLMPATAGALALGAAAVVLNSI